ncbi:DUF423 domain-containing protein [Salinicola sp. JS01]|uniref:DUF423 domain-containing protein n=1 Tax=Salinicola TaxID=404432 RepID=UPI0004E72023|nr:MULTISPECIES: DUF423 domain-containing protein [Salinicola]KFF47789.1 membrane protein [Gammaproteobacteria bacterium MFB021]WIX32992.1 DUF423 domain-containing protein [Salinicola sp. JS01]
MPQKCSAARPAWVGVAISGLLVVVAGAFGAHALADRLTPRYLEVFHTAVRYQAWHTLAIMALLAWRAQQPLRGQLAAIALWFAGMVLFSGSLYLLTLSGITALGIVTPFGGLLLMAGWVMLAIAAWRQRPSA